MLSLRVQYGPGRYSAYGQKSVAARPDLAPPERGGGPRYMRSIEAVVTDLEWQRLRRRVGGHPNALFARCRAWAVLELLKLIARAGLFRST
jgi:hypothetical protein